MAMITADKKNNHSPPAGESSLEPLINSLICSLQGSVKNPYEIEKKCIFIKEQIKTSACKAEWDLIYKLTPFFAEQTGLIALNLFYMLEEYVKKSSEPWQLFKCMLSSREQNLFNRALEIIEKLAIEKSLEINYDIIKYFADKFQDEKSFLRNEKALHKIVKIINCCSTDEKSQKSDQVLKFFYEDDDLQVRFLAASLLDLNHKPVTVQEVRRVLEKESAEFIFPYMEYTRAGHVDLLYLAVLGKDSEIFIDSLRQCEKTAGFNLTRDAVASAGWQKVNYGISVRHFTGLTIMNSLPFFIYDYEADLFERSEYVRKTGEYYFFTACGGVPAEYENSNDNSGTIARFRSYNLTHAEVLKDILDLSPLSVQKVKRIIKGMDKIVDDFIGLFSSHTEECKILPEVYGEIKTKILNELNNNDQETRFSPDVTRLVQMFEDPPTLGRVRTIHGLKRYLHQRGLQLGFKLVNQSQSPTSSITLVLASGTRILKTLANIRYADFEPPRGSSHIPVEIPYVIKIVIDGFMRQLLQGQENFPSVNIFCYGNEIHYFIWFRNHPVFIRIDYSPPLQGGMIDLEYFGVSNYEISYHPNISLDAVRIFFEKMEFDIQLKGTHIHARYDKERTLDLNQLTQKAEYLFGFVPYMMDLDWIIGSLNLDSEAKKIVISAWADMFLRWGTIPLDKLLSEDRQNIIKKINTGPEGKSEIVWDGTGKYQDRFSVDISEHILSNILSAFEFTDIEIHKFSAEEKELFGQLYLERNYLNSIRHAISINAIIRDNKSLKPAPGEIFQRVHEAVRFAEILENNLSDTGSSICLSQIVIPLERTIEFHTTGRVGPFKVQTAKIPLRDKIIVLYILRDPDDLIRMALYCKSNFLFKSRDSSNEDWKYNSLDDSLEFASLLRENNYSIEGPASININLTNEISKIKKELRASESMAKIESVQNERIVRGLRASPGRKSGKISLGISGRSPKELVDHILAVSSISPSENAFIYHAAGIVSTGGGILSHAGLIATQYNKPALIIPGKWRTEQDGSTRLLYNVNQFNIIEKRVGKLHISIYENIRDFSYSMEENDLVVLDADKGILEIIGQSSDTLSLYENLKTLSRTVQQLAQTTEDNARLILRGRQLKIRHHIERILTHLKESILARYALYEILSGDYFMNYTGGLNERVWLLNLLLKNPHTGKYVEGLIKRFISELSIKYTLALEKVRSNLSAGWSLFDIIKIRLDAKKNYEMMESISESLRSCDINEIEIPVENCELTDKLSFIRLNELRKIKYQNIKEIKNKPGGQSQLKHLLRQVERINLLTGELRFDTKGNELYDIRQKLEKETSLKLARLKEQFIIDKDSGGLELFPLAGMKAANLAEIDKLGIKEMIPQWFAVSNKAFQTMLSTPINHQSIDNRSGRNGEKTLIECINSIISKPDLDNKQKSSRIRILWEDMIIPEAISNPIIKAYNKMKQVTLQEDKEYFFVAVRSSSCEEDTETAARAGEFDTFLYISGENELLKYLKLTWSSLWSERALHNRAVSGYQMIQPHGGVIIQQIVNSRVSGVLLTINAARNESREMVINAGLGLGEGIVSGKVAADQVIVSKDEDLLNGHPHFNYVTADKNEQIIFNKNAGTGTFKTTTLYHQRFRAALEYTELCELVKIAAKLEGAYGYPLDIEFAIEESRLYILQVRPVALFLRVFNETMNRYPLIIKEWKNSEEIKV
jgi:hypothetical protein